MLGRPKGALAPMERGAGDFWLMTVILAVALIGTLVALARIAGIV